MRKKKSFFNMVGSLGSYAISLIFTFITQRCLIHILGIEYSGVNGLFNNILAILSIAELGIGSTIIFRLYKPIAEDNKEEIKSWMNFYKICYRFVALFITIIGLIIIPLIPMLINSPAIKESIITLYLISLLDVVISYCMTYKRSLLYANQKNYIINIVHIGYTILMNLTQIILIYLFKSYILYLIIKVIYRLIENIIINLYVNKNYPYINEPAKDINKEEKKDVFERIKAIFLQKISFAINKGIDGIIISYFLGIATVGYYTNYNLIVITISNIIYQTISSLTASVGNLLTENNINKNYDIYKKINLLNSFLTGMSIIIFICIATPFITIWIGNKYLFSNYILIAFALYLYTDSIRRSITLYKEAAGICKEDKYMYIIMTIINLTASIILCKITGVIGVILGTSISYLFLMIYSYPKYIYKPLFKKGFKNYYKDNLTYLVFIIIASIISFTICNQITLNNSYLQLIFNGIVSIIIGSIIFIMIFRKKEEFQYYIKLIKR